MTTRRALIQQSAATLAVAIPAVALAAEADSGLFELGLRTNPLCYWAWTLAGHRYEAMHADPGPSEAQYIWRSRSPVVK